MVILQIILALHSKHNDLKCDNVVLGINASGAVSAIIVDFGENATLKKQENIVSLLSKLMSTNYSIHIELQTFFTQVNASNVFPHISTP